MTRKSLAVVALITSLLYSAAGQAGRGTAEVMVNGKKISINYGRPNLQGRDMLGMATPGMVWRVGMNSATQIESAADLMVNGKEVKAGKYTLWAKKTGPKTWLLGFHPKTGVWGAPELKEGYIAELPLAQTKVAESVEQLTIGLSAAKGDVTIKIQWGTDLLSGSFKAK